jgi:hypothetical protein
LINGHGTTTTNNTNQAFYFQASWGRLEIKPHDQKIGENKSKKGGKQRVIKKLN